MKKQDLVKRTLRSLAAAAFVALPTAQLAAETIDVPEGTVKEYELTQKTGVIDDLKFTGSGTLVLNLVHSDTKINPNFDNFTGVIRIQNAAKPGWGVKLSTIGSFTENPNITLDVADGAQLFLNHDMPNDVCVVGSGSGNGENRGALRIQATASGNIYLKGDTTFGLEFGSVSAISGTGAAGEVQTLTLGTSVSNGRGNFNGIISDGENGGKLAVAAAYGTVNLNAKNTFTGGLTINNSAVVKLADAARTAGNYQINDNGRLEMNFNGSADLFENMVFSGNGIVRLVPTHSNAVVASGNFDNFSGTVQIAAGTDWNKFRITPKTQLLNNQEIAIDVLSGGQIFLTDNVTVANPIRIAGTGNGENRGAIRLTSGAITGAITLTDDAVIGVGYGTISGSIAGSAAENESHTLTFGTSNESGSCTISGSLSDGGNGGKLNVHTAYGNTAFTAANTASGSLVVTGGAATFANKNAFSSVAVEGGTLTLNRSGGTIPTATPITVGTESGAAAVLKLEANKALGDHTGAVALYKGARIEINGNDVSIGNNHGIDFIGGGDVAGNGFFWLRGNGAKFTLTGANAESTISCQLNLYHENVAIDVQDASSRMTISSKILSYDDGSGKFGGLNKQGAGELILTNTATDFNSTLNVLEGKLTLTDAIKFSNADVSISEGAVFRTERGATVKNYALNGTQEMTIVQNDDALEILPLNVSDTASFGDSAVFSLAANDAFDFTNVGVLNLLTANTIDGPEKIQVQLPETLFPGESIEVFANLVALENGFAYQLNLDLGNSVPEPTAWTLLLLGAFGIVGIRRLNRKTA